MLAMLLCSSLLLPAALLFSGRASAVPAPGGSLAYGGVMAMKKMGSDSVYAFDLGDAAGGSKDDSFLVWEKTIFDTLQEHYIVIFNLCPHTRLS